MKNQDHVVTVDKDKHAKLRVKPNPGYVHAKDLNLVAIALNELSACSANYPLVFIQNPETGRYRLAAMFGLRPGENVYYSEAGWDCTYVPLMIQRDPFLIGFDDRKEDDSTNLTMCLDKNSPFLSEDEGIAMFTPEGEETDFLKSRNLMLSAIFEGDRIAEQFTQKLVELDLFAPFELVLQLQNEELRKITGMYTLDERKLAALSPEQILELHNLGFLSACHLIMASVFQVHRLMRLRNRKSGELANYRIDLPPQS